MFTIPAFKVRADVVQQGADSIPWRHKPSYRSRTVVVVDKGRLSACQKKRVLWNFPVSKAHPVSITYNSLIMVTRTRASFCFSRNEKKNDAQHITSLDIDRVAHMQTTEASSLFVIKFPRDQIIQMAKIDKIRIAVAAPSSLRIYLRSKKKTKTIINKIKRNNPACLWGQSPSLSILSSRKVRRPLRKSAQCCRRRHVANNNTHSREIGHPYKTMFQLI